MRCGMSEPVTKTVCSVTFSFGCGLPLTGVSASAALAATRTVTPAAITLFTTKNTPAGLALQIVKQKPDRTTEGVILRCLPGIQTVSLELSQNFFVRRTYQNRFVAS